MEHRDTGAADVKTGRVYYLKHSFPAMMLFVMLYAAVFAVAWFSHFVWGVGLTPVSFVVLFAIFLVCILVLLGIADPRRLAKAAVAEGGDDGDG